MITSLMKKLIVSWTVCWVMILPAVTAAKEKLPKNTQIVYPNSDGSAVELRVTGTVRKRLLVKTEWSFSRQDINKVNTLVDNYADLKLDVTKLEADKLKLSEELAAPVEKLFLSTTVGHWTLGISAVTLMTTGIIIGHNLKR